MPLHAPVASGGEPLDSIRLLRGADASAHTVDSPAHPGPSSVVPRPPFRVATRILLPLALLAGFAAVILYTAWDSLWPATPVRVATIVLASTDGATAAPVGVVQAPGWIEPDPFPVAISALADGVVKELTALEGQPVSAGDVVARLVDDDAKLAVARADAELATQRATLVAAQQRWDHPYERTREVDVAKAKAAEADAALTMLESEIAAEAARTEQFRYEKQRVDQALEQKAATPLEGIVARQRLAAQEATLAAAEKKRAVLQAQQVRAAAELAAAGQGQTLRIEEVRALAEAKAAVAAAEAALAEAKLRLERTQIRSPATGIVMSRLIAPGSKLMLAMDHPDSATVARLYDPANLQVRVDVPLGDAGKVSVSQQAEIVVSVLPERVFQGEVTRIVNEADIAKNTQQFKVRILDPIPQLKPEMLARVKLLQPAPTPAASTDFRSASALFAPAELLTATAGAEQAREAWVVDQGRARKRAVKTGPARKEGWVQILEGLQVGDRIIADVSGLADGQLVRVDGEWVPTDSGKDTQSSAEKGAAHGVH